MQKIKYLDGLRGICCFIVLIDHSINILKPDIRYTNITGIGGIIRRLVSLSPINIVYSGIGPVCIFFILSGFVLSLKYNQTRDSAYITDGIVKRYPRLVFPIIASMLFMYIIFKLSDFFLETHYGLTLKSSIWQAVYVAPFTHSILSNSPLWTISFEIFGSYLLFSVLSIFGKIDRRMLFYILIFVFLYLTISFYCLFIAGLIICEMNTKKGILINKKTRLIMFLIGMFLVTTPFKRFGVDLYSGIYKYLILTSRVDYNLVYNLLVISGSILIFLSILNSTISIRILSLKPFSFLGKISFPLYLTHIISIEVINSIMKKYQIISSFENYLLCMTILIPISIGISYLFELLIDSPSVKVSSKISNKIIN